MFDWLFVLLAPVLPDDAPKKDYIGLVAAETAYAALVPEATPVKPKVPTKDCTNCKGTGKVPTGDGQGWTKCPECDPSLSSAAFRGLPTVDRVIENSGELQNFKVQTK